LFHESRRQPGMSAVFTKIFIYPHRIAYLFHVNFCGDLDFGMKPSSNAIIFS